MNKQALQNLVFIVLVVASLSLSFGYLNNSNGINLWIQQVGVGQTIFDSPITNGGLTILIERVEGGITGSFDDLIVACIFRSVDVTIPAESRLICKLLDDMDPMIANVIAEGDTILLNDVLANMPVTIPIEEGQNNIQFVRNVIVIVQGPDQN